MGTLKRTLGHAAVYMAATVINRGVAFLLVPYYTRALAPADFARWDLSMTVVLFLLPVLELNIGNALLRFYHVHDDPEKRNVCLSTGIWFAGGLTLLWTTGMLLQPKWLAQAVFHASDQAFLAQLIGLVLAATTFSNLTAALLRAAERSLAYSLLSILRVMVGVPMIFLFVGKYQMGPAGILMGDLAGLSTQMIGGFILCRKHFRLRFSRHDLASLLVFTLPLLPFAFSSTIILQIDRFFMQSAAGLEGLAPYSLAYKVAMIIALASQAFQFAWPASAYQISKAPDAADNMIRAFRFLLATMTGTAFAVSVAAPELVQLFGPGPAYASAPAIVPWISFSGVAYCCVLFMLTGLSVSRRTGAVTIVAIIACAVKFALNFALIGRFGAAGVAAATLFTFLIELILSYFVAQRVYPLPYPVKQICGFALAVTVLTLVAVFAGSHLPMWQGILIRGALLPAFLGTCVAFNIVSVQELKESARWASQACKALTARIAS